jgi:hypothetical protein
MNSLFTQEAKFTVPKKHTRNKVNLIARYILLHRTSSPALNNSVLFVIASCSSSTVESTVLDAQLSQQA